MAPSVTITSRHRIASSTTPRDGSAKRGVSSPAAAEPGPMRRAAPTRTASMTAEAAATVARGSTPSAASSAANAAPVIAPNDQPACSDDMIGRPRRCSTPTPWLFIATSIVALVPPMTNRPAAASSGWGASTARFTASAHATPPAHVTRTEPCRTTAWPATGRATMTASDVATSSTPISLLDSAKGSWTQGIWATQVPMAAPFTKKTPVVAQRGLRCRGARDSPGTVPPPRRAAAPRSGGGHQVVRRGGGRGRRLGAAHVEAERRVGVGHQRHVGADPVHPAVEAHHEVEQARYVAPGEEQRDANDEHEQADQAAVRPRHALVRPRPRAPAAAGEDRDDDEVRDGEQPPLHEHEPARERLRVGDLQPGRVVRDVGERERRVAVGPERLVGVEADAPRPAHHADVEVEQAAWVAPGEQDREEGDHRHHDERDPQEDEADHVGDDEHPLHEPQPAAERLVEIALESEWIGVRLAHGGPSETCRASGSQHRPYSGRRASRETLPGAGRQRGSRSGQRWRATAQRALGVSGSSSHGPSAQRQSSCSWLSAGEQSPAAQSPAKNAVHRPPARRNMPHSERSTSSSVTPTSSRSSRAAACTGVS